MFLLVLHPSRPVHDVDLSDGCLRPVGPSRAWTTWDFPRRRLPSRFWTWIRTSRRHGHLFHVAEAIVSGLNGLPGWPARALGSYMPCTIIEWADRHANGHVAGRLGLGIFSGHRRSGSGSRWNVEPSLVADDGLGRPVHMLARSPARQWQPALDAAAVVVSGSGTRLAVGVSGQIAPWAH